MWAVVCLAVGCATTAGSAEGPALEGAGRLAGEPAPGAPPPAAGGRVRDEKLVVTGELTAITDDVNGLVAAIRAHAEAAAGSVSREDVSGDAQHRHATVELRLPPPVMAAFVGWVAARASVDDSHLASTDVTRQFLDRDLAIQNLEVTMSRLEELARRPNGELADLMAVEHEMTRVRGEIETLRGEQRLQGDQIARATLTISVLGKHDVPELKFELVPHLTLLHLVDAGGRAADRAGAGVSVMFSRWFSLDVEVLPRRGADDRSYLVTLSTAMYSDFMGGGRRRFGNPYLGLRVGGARLNDAGAFAYGVEAGVEIFRTKLFLVEVSGRALGLWYNRDAAPRTDAVLEGIVGFGVPF
jgi:hypothetical protein